MQGLVLEELCLHGCKELTDYSVEALVKHQPTLRRLDISACTELTNRSVEAAAHGLKRLTHLSLSGDWRITEKGAHHCINSCIYNSPFGPPLHAEGPYVTRRSRRAAVSEDAEEPEPV